MYGITANYNGINRKKGIRAGAKCFLTFLNRGNGSDRVKVLGLCQNSRLAQVFVPFQKLSNFRIKWVREPLREAVVCFPSRREAESTLSELAAIRAL